MRAVPISCTALPPGALLLNDCTSLNPATVSISVPLSIDTYKPEVARAAVAAGVDFINDVFGFQRHAALAEIAADNHCGVILMHQDAALADMSGDLMARIKSFLDRSISIAVASGVAPGTSRLGD